MSSLTSLDEKVNTSNEHQAIHSNDPFRVVEMAFELQLERFRAVEALRARDVALQHLADAYSLLKQKTDQLESIQPSSNASTSSKQVNVNYMGAAVKMLREESQSLKDLTNIPVLKTEPPPCYEAEFGTNAIPTNPTPTNASDLKLDAAAESRVIYATPGSDEPSEMVHARYAVLSAIPVPPDAPDDTLRPILIPPPVTFSEFISSMPGPLRNSLSNYRILHGVTTVWCPEREEHGYFYAPRFRCSTNPRVATAHRWNQVDVISPMSKPTECFFNKDGTWYYAGIYEVFAMDDLTVKEWVHLSPETSQAIIKETLSGRKNTSPQNVYETGQLYAAGALRVACVGLQCVGFNQIMYKALLEHAGRFKKSINGHGVDPTGCTSPQAHWNTSCKTPKE